LIFLEQDIFFGWQNLELVPVIRIIFQIGHLLVIVENNI
jgi:hypothetical protein